MFSPLAAGQVEVIHDGSETVTGSFEVVVEDGNEDVSSPTPQTVNISVTPVNDPPVLGGSLSAAFNEGAAYTLTTTELTYTDPEDGDADVTFTVSGPQNVSILVGGVSSTTFTGTQLVSGSVQVVHDDSQTTTASFNVEVEDGNEDSSVPVAQLFQLQLRPSTIHRQSPEIWLRLSMRVPATPLQQRICFIPIRMMTV